MSFSLDDFPLPQQPWPYVDPKTGFPTQAFLQFFQAMVSNLRNGTAGPLTEATDDAAAAAAGVPVGGLYQNTTVVGPPAVVAVQIRTA